MCESDPPAPPIVCKILLDAQWHLLFLARMLGKTDGDDFDASFDAGVLCDTLAVQLEVLSEQIAAINEHMPVWLSHLNLAQLEKLPEPKGGAR